MKEAARAAFVPMTIAFEGGYAVNWLFPDVKGLVSTGFGLLLEPVAAAIALPWRRADGSLASREEIVADYLNVKSTPNAARLGHLSVRNVAKLRLDHEGLYQAFQGKLNQNELVLRGYFPEWDEWCADAQLGVLSMAWAVGPHFAASWPKFTAALRARDWRTAAVECFLPEERTISGLRPRNIANRILFQNAAIIAEQGRDRDELAYPADLTRKVDPEAETLPEIFAAEEPESAVIHRLRYCVPNDPPDGDAA